MTPSESHEGVLSVRDQIERYRSAFIAVVTMVVIAAAVGGYILAHENLKLPSWVPVLGHTYFKLDAEFQTAQAVTPGQGQAVTIAGAKIGEIATVDLHNGVAIVTMNVNPEVRASTSTATRRCCCARRPSCRTSPSRSAPARPPPASCAAAKCCPCRRRLRTSTSTNSWQGSTPKRAPTCRSCWLACGEGLKGNGRALAATLKRFDPTARLTEEIAQQLEIRHANVARSIHNFRLLAEALGDKDQQLSQLVDASNAVFATFAKEDASFEKTLALLPGALHKTGVGLGKLATATHVLAPTLHELLPFARALGPANEATRELAEKTTPIIKNEIRPFAREILPVVDELGPATQKLGEALPKLAVSFSVLNEFFNEIAYNPGPSKGGFLFFLDWGNHNLNSVLSTADAHGVLGRSLVYFNCKVLPIFKGAAEINPTVNLLVGLLKPPTKEECVNEGIPVEGSAAARGRERARSHEGAGGRSLLGPGSAPVRREALRCRSARPRSATCW